MSEDSTERNFAIIYNPTSAAGKSKKKFDLAIKTLNELGLNYTLFKTEQEGHAIDLAEELARKGYYVVGAGGDGTCNEVLNGVMNSGSEKPIGFIPIGTGNDIPAALGIPPDVKRACEIIAEGNIDFSDLGLAQTDAGVKRYFLGIGSQGFDAEVTKRTNEGKKRLSGTWNYLISVIKTIFPWKNRAVRIILKNAKRLSDLEYEKNADVKLKEKTVNDPENKNDYDNENDENEIKEVIWEGPSNCIEVGNGPSFGGGMYICPHAKIHDGLFHITIVQMGKFKLLYDFNKLYSSTLFPHPNVFEYTAEEVRIEMLKKDDKSYICQVDGEVLGDIPVSYKVLPNAHKFFMPKIDEAAELFKKKYKRYFYA
ncbi:MAG: diacylglycerol/lipid kinase family protein [Promethearchaeota archaeon]